MRSIVIQISSRCAILPKKAPLEIEASKFNLNYIKLDGSIACPRERRRPGHGDDGHQFSTSAASRPISSMSAAARAKEQVTCCLQDHSAGSHVKGILVNIFGGIMDCNIIATGIVAAVKETGLETSSGRPPRRNNVDAVKKLWLNPGLTIITGGSMADAAQKVVKAVAR